VVFFSAEFLQTVDFQLLLGDQTLEPIVLRFQFLEPTRVSHIHPAELVAPTIERLFRKVVALA
jgi:hypothetical protein